MITKYTKKALSFSALFPWLLGTAFIVGLWIAIAIVYLDAGWETVSKPGAIVLGLTTLAWCFISSRYVLDRWVQVAHWNDLDQVGYGIAITSETRTPADEHEITDSARLVNRIQDAVNFWIWASSVHGKQPYPAQAIVFRALEGVTITLVDEPIRTQYGLAGGTQTGHDIRVVCPPKIAPGTCAAYVQHELAHLMLTALGVEAGAGGENHHRVMEAVGFSEAMQRIAKTEERS